MTEFKFPRSVWVSYASQEQKLVHSLTKKVNSSDNNINMMTYLRDADNKPLQAPRMQEEAEPDNELKIRAEQSLTTYLKPWESIDDLIQTIGGNLRRMIFLSDSYLNSYYCMQELVCILSRKPESPLCIVLVNIKGGYSKLCDFREYNVNTYGSTETLTLAQALSKVYQRRKTEDFLTPEFEIEDDDNEIAIELHFTQRLAHIAQRLRTTAEYDTQFEDKEYCTVQLNDTCEALQNYLIRYAHSFSVDTIISEYQEAKKRTINKWLNTSLGASYKDIDDNSINKAEQLNAILTKGENIATLCRDIKRSAENSTLTKRECFQQAQPVISLMLTSFISTEWAAEMYANHIYNSPIRVEAENNKASSIFKLQVGVSAIHQHPMMLSPISNTTEFPKIEQFIDLLPTALEESTVKQNKPINDILRLVTGLSKDHVEEILENEEPHDLRARIGLFQENHHGEMGGCSLPPISLRANYKDFDRETKNIPEAFEQVMTLVNSDLLTDENEKKIQFALLIMSNGSNNNVVLIGKRASSDIISAVRQLIVDLQGT